MDYDSPPILAVPIAIPDVATTIVDSVKERVCLDGCSKSNLARCKHPSCPYFEWDFHDHLPSTGFCAYHVVEEHLIPRMLALIRHGESLSPQEFSTRVPSLELEGQQNFDRWACVEDAYVVAKLDYLKNVAGTEIS